MAGVSVAYSISCDPAACASNITPRQRWKWSPDGRSVEIRDRKLKTKESYFIGQTPLKFLLQPKIDIAKDSKVTDLKRAGADIILSLDDKSTLGGTSRSRVIFDGESYALKEWTVTDPQGNAPA